jgi:hypothetical protein
MITVQTMKLAKKEKKRWAVSAYGTLTRASLSLPLLMFESPTDGTRVYGFFQAGRDFDVVENVFDDGSDLGFNIAERSGEDVSLRNGTKIPVW